MKFKFQLEAALRLAERAEEAAKTILGKCVSEQERLRQAIHDLRTELREETALQQSARLGEIWAQGQTLFFDWVRGQAVRIAAVEEAFVQAQARVAEARAVLVEKRRAVEVLNRLRERRYAQWRLEVSRKELAEGSDIAARRWMRDHATS
ncbi:MAG: flagellar export protein FliJ [Fibrobacterota bacterium]|nr:flagellar export protein FliJ [Fibrobacterota bacterium]QQS05737.1 MAG: flagellar export protein FliJ [Fibrobacterota bacterium]